MNEVKRIGELNCTYVNHAPPRKGVVILCHGFGAPGTDLVPIAKELTNAFPELNELAFIFPQAPIELDPYFDARAWWMIDIERIQMLMMSGEFRELRDSKPAELTTRREQINLVVDQAMKELELPAEKVVLGGFSQGAMVATEVVLNHPEQLGGLIVWSGTLLNEKEWTDAAGKKEPITIFQSHGRQDPLLPYQGGEYLRDMLTQAGQQVGFVPFDGEHTIGMDAYTGTVKMLKNTFGP